MLQLHLSYQQFNCLLRCDLHKRFYGKSFIQLNRCHLIKVFLYTKLTTKLTHKGLNNKNNTQQVSLIFDTTGDVSDTCTMRQNGVTSNFHRQIFNHNAKLFEILPKCFTKCYPETLQMSQLQRINGNNQTQLNLMCTSYNFILILCLDILSTSHENTHTWMPQDPTNYRSTYR